MAARNRVAPTSEIVAYERHGACMGNRGRLHDGQRIVRPHQGRRWIVCDLDFRGRRVPQWAPGRYTVLFFDDEAVALAAGHRPCAECRRPRFEAFRDAWLEAHGTRPMADALDRELHASRLEGRRQRTHEAPWPSLPVGAFARLDDAAVLVRSQDVVTWTVDRGYGAVRPRPDGGTATVLTPSATVAVLAHGYEPLLAVP